MPHTAAIFSAVVSAYLATHWLRAACASFVDQAPAILHNLDFEDAWFCYRMPVHFTHTPGIFVAVFLALFTKSVAQFLRASLDDTALEHDLPHIRFLMESIDAAPANMRTYYTASRFCYALLECGVHSGGMHSSLYLGDNLPRRGVQPHSCCRKSSQAVPSASWSSGAGAAFAACICALLPGVEFTAVDVVEEHIQSARAAALNDQPAFHVLDACDMTSLDQDFDLVFAVESMCHLGTHKRLHKLGASLRKTLRRGGSIVLIDGFRAADFAEACLAQQAAMQAAEHAFHIERMFSRREWAAVMNTHGLSVRDTRMLTAEVLPFWTKAWRCTRLLLHGSAALAVYARWSDSARMGRIFWRGVSWRMRCEAARLRVCVRGVLP